MHMYWHKRNGKIKTKDDRFQLHLYSCLTFIYKVRIERQVATIDISENTNVVFLNLLNNPLTEETIEYLNSTEYNLSFSELIHK